ncbi:hypothetical protein [Peribacillus frigoritolerans]|uniref:hypothetical protein n=1 Tax=Peribacillus frigoritolerans TaxID=450367 RepID=UPI002E21CB82|nr:hypothetical protein [Peribacillus frigoritolerans]
MKINVEIDEEIKAIEVLIRNHEWNEEVQELMERRRGKDRILSAEKKKCSMSSGQKKPSVCSQSKIP